MTLCYLNGYNTAESFWGYLYLQGDDMVNYGGIDLNDQANKFDFTMTSDGQITPSSHVADAPKVTNMRYDQQKDIITADGSYNGRTLSIVLTRPTEEQNTRLNEFYDILLEEGIVGGYEDKGAQQKTDVTDDDATEPMRARRR